MQNKAKVYFYNLKFIKPMLFKARWPDPTQYLFEFISAYIKLLGFNNFKDF